MGLPAARITDLHICPMLSGLIPHVGGPLIQVGCPTVLVCGLPAAQLGAMLNCIGPSDIIADGSKTVLIGGIPTARLGEQCSHGGKIVGCAPTVFIG